MMGHGKHCNCMVCYLDEQLQKALEANKNLIIVHKSQMQEKKEGDKSG
ncbi:hypothetical protein HY407_02990 [Candidatus Gottesmanbacteria bacterium]|nr:hypothetical protein [Candidatus Gottesmanbacteria bacterium]